jgi:alkylation response protein AidB-like acyl-CoA dehydrogenase
MDLTPDPDQDAFRIATADWCRDNMPLEAARARPTNIWQQMEAMGWIGMTAPALGLDHATEALVFAELGRFLAPVGLLSSAVAARWVGGDGKTALALPSEGKVRLCDAESTTAALGIWQGQAGIIMVPGSINPGPGLDLSASLAVIDLPLTPNPIEDPRAALHLQLLVAAYAVGCADAARDMAAGYANFREQFERPIGWFQSIKHFCADMAVRCAVARSQLYYAACALDADEGAAFHIAAAKRLAATAAMENARANIQIHGGIGMTEEATPHLLLKRAHLLCFIAPTSTADLLGPTG